MKTQLLETSATTSKPCLVIQLCCSTLTTFCSWVMKVTIKMQAVDYP